MESKNEKVVEMSRIGPLELKILSLYHRVVQEISTYWVSPGKHPASLRHLLWTEVMNRVPGNRLVETKTRKSRKMNVNKLDLTCLQSQRERQIKVHPSEHCGTNLAHCRMCDSESDRKTDMSFTNVQCLSWENFWRCINKMYQIFINNDHSCDNYKVTEIR